MNTATQITFDWVVFYMEFADKLLTYKNNREKLLSILEYAHKQAGIKYPFIDKESGQPFNDICPFTALGTFNKGFTMTNRIALIKAIAKQMDIRASEPTNFDGVPLLMHLMSHFPWHKKDIGDLWYLYEAAINLADNPTESNRSLFIKWYNTVIKHKGISWNITMGLFWTRPYFYLNLDGTNRQFLLENDDVRFIGIKNMSNLKQVPDAETYLNLAELCQKYFADAKTAFHSFPELSQTAWLATSTKPPKHDKKSSEANFLQWFEPMIEALKDLGGSATPEATRKQIILNLDLPDEVVNETRGKTGVKKFDNEVAFARSYLAYEGIIDKTVHGVWGLTEKGKNITMTHELASEIFYKWVNIFKERREKAQDDEIQERETPEKHFWIYAPGENSRKWDEFYLQSIMGIGWDDLGNLTQYLDREAMRTKMKELYDETKSYRNDSLATWQFVHTMREGDIVFAKKGMREIVGRGIVESDYIFMPGRNEYKHVRKIKWTHNGSWEHPGQAVMKTLTDITSYIDYVQKLELLITGDGGIDEIEPENEIRYESYSADDFLDEVFMETEQYETLVNLLRNKKNIILQGAPGVGKTFAAKRLAYSIIGEKDISRVTMVQFHQNHGPPLQVVV